MSAMEHKFRNIEHEVIFNKLTNDNYLSYDNPEPMKSEDYYREISHHINVMNNTRENYAYRYISSHRKILGSTIVFGKKVIRKLLKWYIDPIAIQQTNFNNAVTPSIGKLTELVSGLNSDFSENIQQQKMKMFELQENYESQLNQMRIQHLQVIERLEAKLEANQALLDLHAEKLVAVAKSMELLESIDSTSVNTSESNFYLKKSYSQSGEDSILAYIIRGLGISPDKVDYIDLGANHAREMSNTYYFYSMGAKGVIVEANPELIPELKFYRHRDIILNNCIDVISGKNVDFYLFNGDGLSTSDYNMAQNYCNVNSELEITGKTIVRTITLPEILDTYFAKGPTILSIDIEGKEMEILESIDFNKYRPLLIVTEMIEYDTKLSYRTKNEKIKQWLESKDYDEYAYTGINSIFIDRKYLEERNF
ncbi:FkbM family methyltransferase [Paenibacillus lentus]|uniref:FkbM family methyltransferase n=1 Tax=Paenibacillus lentus TaxID=1338368 RepID=UPI003661C436